MYKKDLLGNIIEILDTSGNTMVKYTYDAWGNHTITDYTEFGLGDINPIRYRGYYYDTETGLYYLKSRYYDPQTGRFISMDDISYLDPETIGGVNLYAYCLDNPIKYIDPSGRITLLACVVIGAFIGASVGAISSVISQGIANNGDWSKFNYGLLISDIIFGAIEGAVAPLGLPTFYSFVLDLTLSGFQTMITFAIDESYSLNDAILDMALSTVTFGISTYAGNKLNKIAKKAWSVDINANKLLHKQEAAVRILETSKNVRRLDKADFAKKYVKKTVFAGILYYIGSNLTLTSFNSGLKYIL